MKQQTTTAISAAGLGSLRNFAYAASSSAEIGMHQVLSHSARLNSQSHGESIVMTANHWLSRSVLASQLSDAAVNDENSSARIATMRIRLCVNARNSLIQPDGKGSVTLATRAHQPERRRGKWKRNSIKMAGRAVIGDGHLHQLRFIVDPWGIARTE